MKHFGKNRKVSVSGVVYLCMTILLLGFIFSRSLTPSYASDIESENALDVVDGFLSVFNLGGVIDNHIIRKIAHFSEFAVLGGFITGSVNKLTGKIKKNIFFISFCCLIVPVIDETLQYFSYGRSPEVKDILLDFAGAVTGIIIASLLSWIFKRK